MIELENGSLLKNFIRFILPSIIAQIVFSLYSMVDGIFVARGVSPDALAAVNVTAPFPICLFSIALMFAVGNSTIVAIKLGQGRREEANEIFTQNIVVLCVISIAVTFLVLIFLEPFVRFLGATEAVVSYAMDYVGMLAPFSISYMLSYSFEILIKTDGYPKLATIFVVCGAGLNCVLDWLLVIVYPFGVKGAAFATGISQMVVILLYLTHFLGKTGNIKFTTFRIQKELLIRQIRNGVSSGMTELSSGIIIFLFNQAILLHIGEHAIISYSIISYANTIALMSITGIAQGVQPLIGYSLGKGENEKCRRLLKYSVVAAGGLSVALTVLCFGFGKKMVGLFIANEEAGFIAYSVRAMRIFALSFLVASYNIVIGGYFTAIEKAGFATMISLTRSILALTIALKILPILFGGEAIWWAPTVAEGICLIMSVLMLRNCFDNH